MYKKLTVFIVLCAFLGCSGMTQAASTKWCRVLGSLLISGFIEQRRSHPNLFYGYSPESARVQIAFNGVGFGLNVRVLRNTDKFEALSEAIQNKIVSSFKRIRNPSGLALYEEDLFNQYHLKVTLYKLDPYHYASKLTISFQGETFSQVYKYGFVNAIYPLIVRSKRYLIVNMVSCSASSCDTVLLPYSLD